MPRVSCSRSRSTTKRFIYLAVIAFLCDKAACQGGNGLNLEEDLESWSSLKRRAGYYTQSGRYRGGLYKKERREEDEVGKCVRDNGRYCLSWTTEKRTKKKEKSGYCTCSKDQKQYCASWACYGDVVVFDGDCTMGGMGGRTCTDSKYRTYWSCSCSIESRSQEFCQQWLCKASDYLRLAGEGMYNCTKYRTQYCERWTGEILSKREAQATVCQCDVGQRTHCLHWTCKDRCLRICKDTPGWCSLTFALVVAGGCGTWYLLAGMSAGLNGGSLLQKLGTFYFSVFVCLLFTPGVVIWGGDKAVAWVALMWVSAFFVSLIVLLITLDTKSVEPDARPDTSPTE